MIITNWFTRQQMLAKAFVGVDTLRLALFTNDITPDPAQDYTQFVEATFPGYFQGGMAENYDVQFDPVKGLHFLIWPEKRFERATSGTPETVYGYWVQSDEWDFAWAERFFAPLTLSLAGQAFRIWPKYYLWGRPNTF